MFIMREHASIAADAGAVYDILVDLDRYCDWNPWNFAARGTPRVGGPLIEVDVRLGERTMTVLHKILVMERGRMFRWSDTGWFTWLCYGQRTRMLEPSAGGGCDYTVELQLTGPLVFLTRLMFGKHLVSGLAAETEALKAHAESGGGAGGAR